MYETKEIAITMLTVSEVNFASHDFDSFRDDKEVALVAIERDWRAYEYVSDRLKNDKQVVLATLKHEDLEPFFLADEIITYASHEIQELCKSSDPIKALEVAMQCEELDHALPQKQKQTQTKRLKI